MSTLLWPFLYASINSSDGLEIFPDLLDSEPEEQESLNPEFKEKELLDSESEELEEQTEVKVTKKVERRVINKTFI
jgi:hypothetical protein